MILSPEAAERRDNETRFRKANMARVKVGANQLRAAMLTVADSDVEFTKVYGTVVRDEAGWDHMLLDLEALAGLARMEE